MNTCLLRRSIIITGVITMVAFSTSLSVLADPPSIMKIFRPKQTLAEESLELKPEHGPWLILAATLPGADAKPQAVALAREIRGLLPQAEPEIGAALQRYFEEEGITVVSGIAYRAIRKTEGAVSLTLARDGQDVSISAEQVLITTARSPNVEGLGLEDSSTRFARHWALDGPALRERLGSAASRRACWTSLRRRRYPRLCHAYLQRDRRARPGHGAARRVRPRPAGSAQPG